VNPSSFKDQVSSSSSLEVGSLSWFIRQSFLILQGEFPQAYFLLCAQLAGREVLLVVGGEPVSLAFDIQRARFLDHPSDPDVRLETSHGVILAVIDAQLTLESAVLNGDILLQGTTQDLSLFHEGLLTYIRGGVRCPSFPLLLEQFRRQSERDLDGE
jgi:hypothetical protein